MQIRVSMPFKSPSYGPYIVSSETSGIMTAAVRSRRAENDPTVALHLRNSLTKLYVRHDQLAFTDVLCFCPR